MKLKIGFLAVLLGALLLQGCDSSDKLLKDGQDTAPLIPETPPTEDPNRPRPSPAAPVISTTADAIVDVAGEPLRVRGINLQYAADPVVRYDSIAPIAAAGANVIRIYAGVDTTATLLEAALDKAVDEGMIALVTLVDEAHLSCQEDEDFLFEAVDDVWLGEWLPVLAQDRFQANLMINIANKWGPLNVFTESTISYSAYIDTYKALIRKFRDAGFRVPLVIDAPGCGQDFYAFLGDRARELKNVDVEKNIVLSVHAFERYWNSSAKLRSNLTSLQNTNVPYLVAEFGGSGVGGENAVDHLDLMAKGAGDQALVLDMPWQTSADKAAYVYTLPAPLDLSTGAKISVDAYIPRDYVDDGKLGIQIYLRDTNGEYAALEFESMQDKLFNQWNNLSYTLTSAADIKGWKSDNFNLSAIAKIGIELQANGKPVEVVGGLRFDNVKIVMGPPPEPVLHADFTTDTEGFARDWGAGEGEANAVAQAAGELLIQPTWGAGNTGIAVAYNNQTSGYMDLAKPFTLTVDVWVPEEYAGETLEFQFFVKDTNWNFAAVGYWSDGQIAVGQAQTLTVVVEDLAAATWYKSPEFTAAGAPNSFGFEIKGITSAKTAAIRADNFRIFVPAEGAPGTVLAASFDSDTEGFARDWGAGEGEPGAVTQAEGKLRIQPTWGAGSTNIALARDNQTDQFIDLAEPFTLSAKVFVPAEYEGETLEFQFFVKDGTWKFGAVGYWGDAQIAVGQEQELTIEVPDILELGSWKEEGFLAEGAPNSIGFEIKGITSAKAAPITVDDFMIVVPVDNAAEQAVLDVKFEDPADVAAFTLDYFEGGGWTSGTLSEAKTQAPGIEAFGWIAWSWFGNTAANAAWDLSNRVDFAEGPATVLDLTQRGEEVVEGEFGIRNTRTDAAVSP